MKTFSFRFDIDSLADIEIGVPKLIEIGRRLDVRFTFFINMGKSFNWGMVLKKRKTGSRACSGHHLSTVKRLGLWRTVRTVALNPNIGLSHKKTLFKLLDRGHELALHGGMDHPLWQWGLDELSMDEINRILKPAYNSFESLFGKPKGFASPGFKSNISVLKLLDEYAFKYASDMKGETPFVPEGFNHMQIPVNVIGPYMLPLVEYLRESGVDDAAIINRCIEKLHKKDIAVMYGHPAYESSFNGLQALLVSIGDKGYSITPMEGLI